MGAMFRNTEAFNQPLNNWDVSSVTNMSFMFYDTNSFNQPLNNWDVSSVTSMGAMFEDAESFNRDLSSWCVSNITSEPSDFDTRASDWILANSRPVWGTCPGVIVDELEINPGTIEVDICPQTYDIIVTSNTSWTVSESLNWATLSTTSGSGDDTITVTLLENTSGIRSGTITFSTADVTVNHTITQQVSSIDTLRLDPDEINAPSNGISYTINVGSNTSWFTTQGTDLSWIYFSRSSGSGCNTSISVTIDPNGSAITRTSQITISTGNITKIHEISQVGYGT
jgi:surface protein